MVRIVNGEIVRDDGPGGSRPAGSGARPRRGEAAPAGGSAPPAPSNGRQSRFMQSADLHDNGPQPGVHREAQDPLSGLARAIGVEGAYAVPAISTLGLPAREVPLIYFIVLGVLTLLFGPRALLIAAVLYVVAGRMSPNAAAGQAGGNPGPGGRPVQGRPLGR